MPKEDDLRFKLLTSINTLLKFAAHDKLCPEVEVVDEGTDEPCPCGFRAARRTARSIAAEALVTLEREDSEAW